MRYVRALDGNGLRELWVKRESSAFWTTVESDKRHVGFVVVIGL